MRENHDSQGLNDTAFVYILHGHPSDVIRRGKEPFLDRTYNTMSRLHDDKQSVSEARNVTGTTPDVCPGTLNTYDFYIYKSGLQSTVILQILMGKYSETSESGRQNFEEASRRSSMSGAFNITISRVYKSIPMFEAPCHFPSLSVLSFLH